MSHPLPIPMTEIRPESLAWLWPGYIPKGKLTLLDGDPGLGKSLTTIDLAARLSRGRPLPDGSGGGAVGRTLILQCEDGTANTLLPRLAAAGADLEQVFVFPDEGARVLRFPWNTPWFERSVRAANVSLAIVDPMMAFLSRRIWAGSDQMIRRVLGRLADVADRTGAAIVLIRHLNKSDGQKALYRGSGSIGIVGSARSALLAAAHPSGDGRTVLAATKSNLGPTPPAQTYHIVGNESGVATIAWDGPVDLTADEALNPLPAKDDEKLQLGVIQATDWLMAALKDGPVPATEIARAAEAAGIRERTLDRAKKPAKVESKLEIDKETNERRWVWRLFKPCLPPLDDLEEIW